MATESTLRYVQVDFQSHKDALLQRVRARFPRVWNDFLNNSFGVVLVDIIAWSTATVAFLINRAAGENFISTMTLRESAVNIGSLTGYQLRGPTSASVSCEASISQPQATDTVTIPKGTVIRSTGNTSLPFEVAQDYFILPGNTTPITPVVSINPALSGAQVLSTFVLTTPGSANVDLLDTTINLLDFVQTGETFQVTGDPNTYLIADIQASPGAVSNNRLVLATPFVGASQATTTATIYDQRILCIQGLTVTDSFVAPGSNTPSFVVKLSTTPVIDGSVSVTVNGEAWNLVTSFAKSSLDSTDFTFQVTSSGQPLVLFGDGILGALVPTNAAINVTYRVGGGSSGNIGLNSFNTTVTGSLSSNNNPITITISNKSSPGSGGQDAETLEQARINIPAATRANDRAVTLEDYQTMATTFSGVSFARAAVRNENSLLEGNIVFVYAWASGPNGSLVLLTPQQKIALTDFMQTKALGTDLVTIGDGTSRPVPVSLRFKTFSGFTVNDTNLLVTDTLNNFIDLLTPGQPVVYSNLLRALDAVVGVDTITMATPTADLLPANSLELFTRPDASFTYALDKNSNGTPVISVVDGGVQISNYTAQMPVYPLQAWSFRLFLGINELTVQPGILPGFAQIFSSNVSSDLNYPSTVNLLTGVISLWIKGVPGDLTMELIPVTGYNTEKFVNIYVGYTGDTSQSKRRAIRSAVRAYGDGVAVGAPIYGQQVPGIIGSASNVTNVIAAINGVTSVNRVALDTPGSTDRVINTIETQLLRIGDVVLNNEID